MKKGIIVVFVLLLAVAISGCMGTGQSGNNTAAHTIALTTSEVTSTANTHYTSTTVPTTSTGNSKLDAITSAAQTFYSFTTLNTLKEGQTITFLQVTSRREDATSVMWSVITNYNTDYNFSSTLYYHSNGAPATMTGKARTPFFRVDKIFAHTNNTWTVEALVPDLPEEPTWTATVYPQSIVATATYPNGITVEFTGRYPVISKY